jgi:hypothetical protein
MDGARLRTGTRCRHTSVTLGIGNAVFGIRELNTAVGLGAGWGINLAVVEYVIRRRISTRAAGRATRVAVAA